MKGLIYNIQRFCLHDGPGIRTVVFLKGCPLRCKWCANPESQKMDIEVMNQEQVGCWMSVDEVLDVVRRDKVFYKHSGGMTISGGEPLYQKDFLLALIHSAKKEGIHITIETCGYSSSAKILNLVDLVLLDIKMMNEDLHKFFTGKSNELILSNGHLIQTDVVVRVPVIPDINDDLSTLVEICKYAKAIEAIHVAFLPYHRLGESKYMALNRPYSLKGIPAMTHEHLEKIAADVQEIVDISIVIP